MDLKELFVIVNIWFLTAESAPHKHFVDEYCSLRPDSYNTANPFANKAVPQDFTTVRRLLRKDLGSNSLYRIIWNIAEREYDLKKRKLSSVYFNASVPDECYTAVIAYTLNSEIFVDGSRLKLFRDFNDKFKELRDEASWERFPYKSLYYLLKMAIPGIKNEPDPRQYACRGINKFHFNPIPKVGDFFYFNYFASFTTDMETAEEFRKEDGTLICLKRGASTAIGIDAYSYYDEDEILVYPNNKFRVKSFESYGTEDILHLEEALVA